MKTGGKNTNSVQNPYKTFSARIITYHRAIYVRKDGKAPIMLEININNQRVRINTDVNVPKSAWDAENQLIRKNYPDYKNLNLIVQNCKSRINDIFVRYKLQFKELSSDILVNEYERPSVNVDFLVFLEAAIKERRGEIGDSSKAQQLSHLNKLKEFKDKIYFSELNEDLFATYNRWLKNTKGNGQNTRWNSIKTIRTYINIAKRRGLIEENPLDHMPVKQCKSTPDFLTEAELTMLVKLYRKKFLPETHQRVLRWYLFSCFASLRISDLRRVKMENIIGTLLVFMPLKTTNVNAELVRVPLNKMAKQLISDESPYRVKGKIFNMISDPQIRIHLKEVLGHAKIRKMTFHSSRHTFATIFLGRTKNLVALQKILGHSNIATTMIYAHCLTEDIEREMKSMDSF